MPYACLLFAEEIDESMRTAANCIAEGSAFEPHPLFHCPIIGSLHHYSAEEVSAACTRVTSDAPLTFRFGKWVITGELLRASVESTAAAELTGRLHLELPRGRPWVTHYVTLGSVAAIEVARREEFLRAVEAAFPIDTTIEYVFRARIEYNEHNVAPHKPPPLHKPPQHKPAPSSTGRPGAAKSRRVATKAPGKVALAQKAALSSPHKRWQRQKARPADSAPTSMDTGTTGSSVSQSAIVKQGRLARKYLGPLARR